MNIHEIYKLLLLTTPEDTKIHLEEEVITIHITEYYKDTHYPITHNILITKHNEGLIAFTSYSIDPLPEWFTTIFNIKKVYERGIYYIEPKEPNE